MKTYYYFIALIILVISCHDNNENNKHDDIIIWSDSGGLIFTPEKLILNYEERDTIVKIKQGDWKIKAIRLIQGKDTLRLDAGKDFPHQENHKQLIDLEWIKITKKEDSNNMYIFVKENDSKSRKCDLHFKLLEGYDKYSIIQENK